MKNHLSDLDMFDAVMFVLFSVLVALILAALTVALLEVL